jgi:hypothetical protein
VSRLKAKLASTLRSVRTNDLGLTYDSGKQAKQPAKQNPKRKG